MGTGVGEGGLLGYLSGFDLFGKRNFVVAAEPAFVDASPWRVLVTAVRRDAEHLIQPWVKRLGGGRPLQPFQSL